MAARISKNGFTLIEIIAVLVILGILAAVAIPKYADLQQRALQNALKGAVAAAQTRLAWTFAQVAITSTTPSTALILAEVNKDANCGVTSNEFSVTCSGGGAAISIAVTHNSTAESITGSWALP